MGSPIIFGPGVDQSSKVPRVAVEFDVTSGVRSLPTGAKRVLLIGQMLAAGTFVPNTPTDIFQSTDTEAGAGAGTVLDQMAKAAYKANPNAVITVIGVSDGGGSAAATDAITIATTATANGTGLVQIGNRLVQFGVLTGDTATVQAAALAAAIAADPTLPVSAVAALGVVTLTAKSKGTCGNSIGVAAGYSTPLTSTITPATATLAGGATDPSIATALANAAAVKYDEIAIGLVSATAGQALQSSIEANGDPEHGLGEVASQAITTTLSDATTLATTINGARNMIHALRGSPSTPWEIAAAAAAAMSAEPLPNRPFNTVVLEGIGAPPVAKRWIPSELKALIASGVGPLVVNKAGKVCFLRAVSTRTINAASNPDDSELDIGVIKSFDFVRAAVTEMFQDLHSRDRFASNNDDGLLPDDVGTPAKYKADLLDVLRSCEALGIVENVEANAGSIDVQKVGSACQWSIPADIIPGLGPVLGKIVLIRTPFGG